LDASEIARADSFHFVADRDAYIAAHALLRTMLSEAAGLHPASWRYVEGAHGKPAIASGCGDRSVQFNISHTRGLVACALVRDFDVGVDVEASDRWLRDYATIYRSFSPDEAKLLSEAPPDVRPNLFFRLWTLKESFIKATGEGLARPLDSFSFRFDPVRIVFHPWSGNVEGRDDVTRWQFEEFLPTPRRLLALTVGRGQVAPAVVDACAVRPGEVVPGSA
jgi:4'-phosphopantetheinyl transferase